MGGTACQWVAPLRAALPELGDADLADLAHFEQSLSGLLTDFPVDGRLDPQLRSRHLCQIRTGLAALNHLGMAVPVQYGGRGRPAAAQTLLQFICGYQDVDLRDSAGLGHGLLLADEATPQIRDLWLPRLLAGEIAGIAITEPHGGSQVHRTQTAAAIDPGGYWAITGTKTWISRLTEAALFCVFFNDPAGRLTAAVVDATSPGLNRRAVIPAGLSGWAWGELHLGAVEVRPCDVLGAPGDGMRLLRRHFAYYRPLVAATALGAAANIHDQVSAWLNHRRNVGAISGLRDNALITLGRTYAEINAALLASLTAQRLAEARDPRAHLWGCTVKAKGVDIAYQAVSELSLLVGAAGFTVSSTLVKVRRDLNALLYADGIHDSLYRSAGHALTSRLHVLSRAMILVLFRIALSPAHPSDCRSPTPRPFPFPQRADMPRSYEPARASPALLPHQEEPT